MGDGEIKRLASNAQFADWMRAVGETGDRAAFAQLFQHFAPRIKAYMLRLGAEDALAEELAQETMLTVWRRAAAYNPAAAAVSTWLFTIARNKRIDGIRKASRPEIDLNDLTFTAEPDRPDQLVMQIEEAKRVRQAIRDLSPEQGGAIRMAYYEGLTQVEISARTGLPLGTVKSRIRLALRRLRYNWEDAPDDPDENEMP